MNPNKEVSRRNFLKITAAAAAGFLLRGALPQTKETSSSERSICDFIAKTGANQAEDAGNPNNHSHFYYTPNSKIGEHQLMIDNMNRAYKSYGITYEQQVANLTSVATSALNLGATQIGFFQDGQRVGICLKRQSGQLECLTLAEFDTRQAK